MGVNDELFDIQIRHYTYLERFKNNEARQAVRLIVRRNREIRAILESFPGREDVQKLRQELNFLESVITESDARIVEGVEGAWEQFFSREVDYQLRSIDGLTPPQVTVAAPSQTQILTAINTRPFQKYPSLKAGFQTFFGESRAQVMGAIRYGYAFGQTTQEIIDKVSALGSLQARHVETWVRSGVAHMAAEARRTLYDANSDIIEREMWVSTLDTRTTPFCQMMDGQLRDVGAASWDNGMTGEPGEAHYNCRSTSIPVIKDWQALGLENPTPGERSSLDGGVPQDTTYETWLSRQSQAVQEEVLGVQRAELFRSGEFTLSQMVRDGRYITLDELMARN